MVEDWEYEERKRSMSLKFGIPMAICFILAIGGIGYTIYIQEMNIVIIIILSICLLAGIFLAYMLFTVRSKYDRMMRR